MTVQTNMGKYSVNKSDVLLLLLAVFVPPVSVLIRRGFFSRDFLLNVLLFVFFFFPAIIHAAYVIYETSEERPQGYESVTGSVAEEEEDLLNNGDFNVDLEANASELPQYDDIVGSSNGEAIAAAAATDNKVQH